MGSFSIGEVAKRTGLRTSALRYYEEAGLLPAPARVSGRRIYDSDTVHRIEILQFAQQAGFSLDEIKTLFHGFQPGTPLGERWRALAREKLLELEALSKRVKKMRRALRLAQKCGCMRIEECTLSPANERPRNRGTPGSPVLASRAPKRRRRR
jgi:MerR family redox-sensitive transcriptional activator SoxR